MRGINKSVVYRYLKKCQEDAGGYSGTNIVKLAQQLNVNRTTLSRSIEKWSEDDMQFSDIKYLGKRYIQITLDEILEIEHIFKDNPLMIKKYLLESINANRTNNDRLPLLKTPFYDFVDKYLNSILKGDNIQYIWLKTHGVTPSKKYSIEEAKNSLNTIFNFDGLKGHSGVDLENIATRLQQSKEWFNEYYGCVDPFNFYEKIKGRVKHLQRHLTSIKADESQLIQVRLIFEIQVAFIVNCQDFLIEQIIHRRGRIHQSIDNIRQKTENQLRGNRIEEILKKISDLINWSKEVDKTVLKEIVNKGHPESTLARIKLLKSHAESYKVLLATLKKITNDLSEQDVTLHTDAAALLIDLARNKKLWKHIDEREQNTLIKDPLIVQMISKGDQDLLHILVTDRIIEYIKNGKITFIRSYKFQDVCPLIKSISLKDSERNVDQKTLTQLQIGNFPIDTEPLTKITLNKTEINEEDDLEEGVFSDKILFQDVATYVSRLVREHNPERFDEQVKIFKEETDNMFSMEYEEDEFYQHLYDAIGSLGRNLRYTDSNEFQNNRYFIQRYVNDRSLDLELSFMWKTLRDILGYSESAIIIDTIGLDGRRKSIFADYHGRYHTIGFADLRAISLLMFPVFSTNCKSTDSEAMNIMEILNHANLVLGGNLKIYTGNGHTTSRASAAMSLLSHKVIATGRITHEPNPPSEHKIKQLKTHIDIMNKVGKILRTDGDLGRIISSRKHIYVDGVDVRDLIEDLGSLILWNVAKTKLNIDNICQLVETSNRLKRVVRIIERGVTRAHNPNISIYLKSSELVLCMCMLMNISTHRSSDGEKPISKASLQKISFFTPS